MYLYELPLLLYMWCYVKSMCACQVDHYILIRPWIFEFKALNTHKNRLYHQGGLEFIYYFPRLAKLLQSGFAFYNHHSIIQQGCHGNIHSDIIVNLHNHFLLVKIHLVNKLTNQTWSDSLKKVMFRMTNAQNIICYNNNINPLPCGYILILIYARL